MPCFRSSRKWTLKIVFGHELNDRLSFPLPGRCGDIVSAPSLGVSVEVPCDNQFDPVGMVASNLLHDRPDYVQSLMQFLSGRICLTGDLYGDDQEHSFTPLGCDVG